MDSGWAWPISPAYPLSSWRCTDQEGLVSPHCPGLKMVPLIFVGISHSSFKAYFRKAHYLQEILPDPSPPNPAVSINAY